MYRGINRSFVSVMLGGFVTESGASPGSTGDRENTRMLFGDAKKVVGANLAAVRS